MECPFCKQKIGNWALTEAVAYWGATFYKIFRKEPLTKSESQMMRTQQMLDRYKCFLCRQKSPNAPY